MIELPHHFVTKHVKFMNNQSYTVCKETNSNSEKEKNKTIPACKVLKAPPPPLIPNYPITVCSLQLDIVDVITDRNKRKRKSNVWKNLIYPYNTTEIKRIKLTEYLSIQRLKRLSEERRRRRREKLQDENENPSTLKVFFSKFFHKKRQENNRVDEQNSKVDNENSEQPEIEKQPTKQETEPVKKNISIVENCDPCVENKDVCPIDGGCGGLKNFCDTCYTSSKSSVKKPDKEESNGDNNTLQDSNKTSNEKLGMQQYDVVFELNHSSGSLTVQNCGTQVNSINLHAFKPIKKKNQAKIGAKLSTREVNIAPTFTNQIYPKAGPEIARVYKNSMYSRKYPSSMLSIIHPNKILGPIHQNYEYELMNIESNEVPDQQISKSNHRELNNEILDSNKIQYIKYSISADNSSGLSLSQSEENILGEVETVKISYEDIDPHLIRYKSDMNVKDTNITRTKKRSSKTQAQIYFISNNSDLHVNKSVQIVVIPPKNVVDRTTSIDHSNLMLNLAFNSSKPNNCKQHLSRKISKSHSTLTASDSNFVLHCENVAKKEIYLSDIDIAMKDSEEYRKQRSMEVAVKVSRLLREMEANGERADVVFINTKYHCKH